MNYIQIFLNAVVIKLLKFLYEQPKKKFYIIVSRLQHSNTHLTNKKKYKNPNQQKNNKTGNLILEDLTKKSYRRILSKLCYDEEA